MNDYADVAPYSSQISGITVRPGRAYADMEDVLIEVQDWVPAGDYIVGLAGTAPGATITFASLVVSIHE